MIASTAPEIAGLTSKAIVAIALSREEITRSIAANGARDTTHSCASLQLTRVSLVAIIARAGTGRLPWIQGVTISAMRHRACSSATAQCPVAADRAQRGVTQFAAVIAVALTNKRGIVVVASLRMRGYSSRANVHKWAHLDICAC